MMSPPNLIQREIIAVKFTKYIVHHHNVLKIWCNDTRSIKLLTFLKKENIHN